MSFEPFDFLPKITITPVTTLSEPALLQLPHIWNNCRSWNFKNNDGEILACHVSTNHKRSLLVPVPIRVRSPAPIIIKGGFELSLQDT